MTFFIPNENRSLRYFGSRWTLLRSFELNSFDYGQGGTLQFDRIKFVRFIFVDGDNLWQTLKTLCTIPFKIKHPVHNIRMQWTNFWQPTIHVQQNIFEMTHTEVCSPHLYASFGTFCDHIGQLLEAQWVFEACMKSDKSLLSKENVVDFGILLNVKKLTVPRIIDHFGRKRSAKIWITDFYKSRFKNMLMHMKINKNFISTKYQAKSIRGIFFALIDYLQQDRNKAFYNVIKIVACFRGSCSYTNRFSLGKNLIAIYVHFI